MFELVYNETVIVMWVVSFICLQVGGAIGWGALKSTLGYLIGQIITFIVMVIFFPDLFGLLGV